MGHVLEFAKPYDVEIIDEALSGIGKVDVRVRTLYSGVSAGTELSAYRGTNPYLTRSWNATTHLFDTRAEETTLGYPLIGWGYSEVGRIEEVGSAVEGLAVGDVVWGIWGHRSEVVLPAASLVGHVVPEGVDPRCGTFSRVASVALNAVLNTQLGIGSHVAVTGLGVIGLIAVRFAVQSGATVVAVDPIAERREHALRWGAAHALAPSPSLADHVRDLTGGQGCDVVIELAGSTRALHEATRLAGPDATVVASGFYQGDAIGLRLGEEFHHNRLRLQCSQIGAVPSQLTARWTRDRLVQTATARVLSGDPDVLSLITHQVPLSEAASVYEILDKGSEDALAVLLDMTGES